MNLWQSLPKPIFCLAPMEDVTDTVFRQILCSTGKPGVFFTEFTNVDGIQSQGHDVVARRLLFTKIEHPIVAQIWGMKPENFYATAKELVAKGFDGIDINMGCPQHDVISHGACSALMKNHALAKEIIQATKEGANESWNMQNVIPAKAGYSPLHGGIQESPKESGSRVKPGMTDREIPVSVKTRIGFKQIQTEEWIGFLLQQKLDLITVHGRTAAEMSKVPCHWDEIGKAVKLRDEWEKKNVILNESEGSQFIKKDSSTQQSFAQNDRVDKIATSSAKGETPRNDNVHNTLIFGNGDVQSLAEAKQKVQEYGVDGVMIGRGIFHNPWLFAGIDPTTKTVTDRLQLLKQHVELYQKTWGEQKSFQVLKKYFKTYLSDFDGASEIRQKFMETNNYQEAIKLADKLFASSRT